MKQQGFTLIELIVTIILMGILAVVVAPRFQSSDSYQAHGYRAQSIATLRAIQLRAMQQTNANCHVVEVSSKAISGAASNASICHKINALNITIPNDENVTFELNGGTGSFSFDSLGIPLGDCLGGCIVSVEGEESLAITIESQGYIHAS